MMHWLATESQAHCCYVQAQSTPRNGLGECKTDGYCQAAAWVNHEHSFLHPSEFPHNVPPLEHFLLEQLSSGILFLYDFCRVRNEGQILFISAELASLTFDIVLAEQLIKQAGLWLHDIVLISLLWCIVYNLISSNSLRSQRSTIPLRNWETQSSVPYDRH